MTDRRNVLRALVTGAGLTLGATALTTMVTGCEQTETAPGPTGKTVEVDVTTYPELNAVGGVATAFVPGLNNEEPVFISRVAENIFTVFTTICTHAGCQVDPPSDLGLNCVCPCHRAEYSSADGTVRVQPTSGSATNLPTFPATYDPTTKILKITA
jgi:thiosulfate dehydrogenase [quinone] large subunit